MFSIKIMWEHYLSDETDPAINPLGSTDAQLDDLSNRLNVTFPQTFRDLLATHAGMTPLNLRPQLPNGKSAGLDCINHADVTNKEDRAYLIDFSTSALAEDGFENLVCFSFRGNVYYCFDYREREINPPVVVILRDFEPDDPDHKHKLADSFDEFLAKYTVPLDQAPT